MALFEGHFPYTNFHDLNLDWLLQKVQDHEERLTQAEQDIDALEGRMDQAEADIDALEGRMDQAEQDIDALEGRMDTAEDDIDALEGRMQTAENDIDALEGRMDTAEGKIGDLEEANRSTEAVFNKLVFAGTPANITDPDNPVPLSFYTELGAGVSASSGPVSFTRCGNVVNFDGSFAIDKLSSGDTTPTVANSYIKMLYPAALVLDGTNASKYHYLGSLRVTASWLQDLTEVYDLPAEILCYDVDAADTITFQQLFDKHASITLGNGWIVRVTGNYITTDTSYYDGDVGPV